MGLKIDLQGAPSPEVITRLVKTRLYDIERQEILGAAQKKCSPLNFQLKITSGQQPKYLSLLMHPLERRAFTLARCNVTPSNDLHGRFRNASWEDH